MAKRKTTKKQVTEPVIEYVDPETNLEAEPDVAVQTPTEDSLFQCMKRRRDKEH